MRWGGLAGPALGSERDGHRPGRRGQRQRGHHAPARPHRQRLRALRAGGRRLDQRQLAHPPHVPPRGRGGGGPVVHLAAQAARDPRGRAGRRQCGLCTVVRGATDPRRRRPAHLRAAAGHVGRRLGPRRLLGPGVRAAATPPAPVPAVVARLRHGRQRGLDRPGPPGGGDPVRPGAARAVVVCGPVPRVLPGLRRPARRGPVLVGPRQPRCPLPAVRRGARPGPRVVAPASAQGRRGGGVRRLCAGSHGLAPPALPGPGLAPELLPRDWMGVRAADTFFAMRRRLEAPAHRFVEHVRGARFPSTVQ